MRPLVAIPAVALALTLAAAAPLVGDPIAHHTRSSSRALRPAAVHPRSHEQRAGDGGAVATSAAGPALVIPSLGVDAPVVATGAVGAPGSASLTIPGDIHTVGWWDGVVTDGASVTKVAAPAPGDPGVAIIAGHVDSAAAGAGALFNLRTLGVGDTIRVVDLGRRTTTWRVISRPQITPKTALPRSLFVTTGAPRLAVVTCGGPFDAATGHYVDNVIVWAAPVRRA